jgi:hypothetical protein
MPMVPETVIAMLACARVGAIHSLDSFLIAWLYNHRDLTCEPGHRAHEGAS